MSKKSYLIIGGTILVFVVLILSILLSRSNDDWTADIKEAQNYQIVMTDCNGKQKQLDNNIIDQLANKWSTLSNNGPWTGDTSVCYTTLTISYEKDGIVKQKEIMIIDESSLALDLNTNTIYYTNAKEINSYLNTLFRE